MDSLHQAAQTLPKAVETGRGQGTGFKAQIIVARTK